MHNFIKSESSIYMYNIYKQSSPQSKKSFEGLHSKDLYLKKKYILKFYSFILKRVEIHTVN